MKKLSSLSVIFPAYNDEKAIGEVVKKAYRFIPSIAQAYEIIVVNDGSTDGTADALLKLKKEIPELLVVSHQRNQGYGATLTDGFSKASKEIIFYTDGDGQYDVDELQNLVAIWDDQTDIVNGYKLNRADPWYRKFAGTLYNEFVRTAFGLPVRDIDCDFRLFRRSLLREVRLRVKSGAFDAHFLRKMKKRKARMKEVGVHHYPRIYGTSQFFNLRRVSRTLWDLFRL